MLHELHVRNLGVLADATVSFSPGVTVVTGETGAGKTLLVTSLALLCGARADSRLVGSAGGETLVEAVLVPPETVGELLRERGLDADDELTVVRRIGADGRSRAWLAGQLVPVSALAEVGRLTVELHAQGDALALARPQAQLDALDAFAGCLGERRAYGAALACVRALEAEHDELSRMGRERARTVDTLVHQLAEIERARLEPGEDESLRTELARLRHADRLAELAAIAVAAAGGDGAAGSLGEAAKALEDASRIDESIARLAGRAGALAAEAADVALEARAWKDGLDADPERLAAVQDRAAEVARLRRRYGETVEDVLRFAGECRDRLATLEGADERAAAIEDELTSARSVLDGAAATLTARRLDAAGRLEALVLDELPGLALPNAVFETVCEPAGRDTEHGRDRVELRFSANSGVAAGPLGRTSSGGELSRVMIALTLALASAHAVPVVVLDEADQGLGGQAALEVGRRIRRLGATHQVLVVTHLPQVAAFADRHLVVEKRDGAVEVRPVEGEERVLEISRMLAGLVDSRRAKAHASELLGVAARP